MVVVFEKNAYKLNNAVFTQQTWLPQEFFALFDKSTLRGRKHAVALGPFTVVHRLTARSPRRAIL